MRVVALLIFFFFLFAGDAFALSLSFDGAPAEIREGGEFEVNVFFSCSSCKDSYLRAVFFKESTTNYFGYTQNEKGDWINTTTDKTLFFHLSPDSLVEGSWSGKLKARPDPDSSYHEGTGNYVFKIGRYTSASSSATWSSNTASIYLIVPTPTPTVTSTATPIVTPTPSPTAKPTTPPTSPPTQTTKLTASFTPTLKAITPTATIASEVLAASQSADPSISAVLSAENQSLAVDEQEPDKVANFAFIGVIATTVGLLIVIYRRLKSLPVN